MDFPEQTKDKAIRHKVEDGTLKEKEVRIAADPFGPHFPHEAGQSKAHCVATHCEKGRRDSQDDGEMLGEQQYSN